MDINKRKEEFGIAYVQAIASVAGYSISRPLVDNDSIDLQFLSNSSNAYTRAPRLEVQLKCTAQDMISGDYINFPLKIKNYDDLRDPNVLVPSTPSHLKCGIGPQRKLSGLIDRKARSIKQIQLALRSINPEALARSNLAF
jgi:hypothetical protein